MQLWEVGLGLAWIGIGGLGPRIQGELVELQHLVFCECAAHTRNRKRGLVGY